MRLKGVVMEDFINYKKASMFVLFPSCTFKCEKECGEHCCQNSALAQALNIDVNVESLVERYLSNPITSAVVLGGLEPLDSWKDVKIFIETLRKYTDDDCVIYTGYNKNECEDKIKWLKQYPNIIIKFGRFITNHQPHYDDVLGVMLASKNQYAEKIS